MVEVLNIHVSRKLLAAIVIIVSAMFTCSDTSIAAVSLSMLSHCFKKDVILPPMPFVQVASKMEHANSTMTTAILQDCTLFFVLFSC